MATCRGPGTEGGPRPPRLCGCRAQELLRRAVQPLPGRAILARQVARPQVRLLQRPVAVCVLFACHATLPTPPPTRWPGRASRRSSEPTERMAGVVAIDELGQTKVFGGSAARLADLVKILMDAFQPTTDQQCMEVAAKTLGHLVSTGGALMADVVEEQARPHACACRGLPAIGGCPCTCFPARPPTAGPGHAFRRSRRASTGWRRNAPRAHAWRACWCCRSWRRRRRPCSTCMCGRSSRSSGTRCATPSSTSARPRSPRCARAWCWWRNARPGTACSGTTACLRRRSAA